MSFMQNAPPGEGGASEDSTEVSARPLYSHPARIAIRAARSSHERLLRVVVAYSDLLADEQDLFAACLVQAMPAGSPVPPLTTFAAEAADWADWACTGELRAYCAACLVRLPEADHKRILAALRGGL